MKCHLRVCLEQGRNRKESRSAMASQACQLHFILVPFPAQGHMIPMIDIGRLLAQRGVLVTIITTPINAARFKPVLDRAIQAGLRIQVIELRFPCQEAGLPEGCENFDMLPSFHFLPNLLRAVEMLQLPLENSLMELKPAPSCIISDVCFPWTVSTASKFNIPRITFHGFCCFSLFCVHSLHISKVHENVSSDSECFVVPGLPDQIEITKAQLPDVLKMKRFGEPVLDADLVSYGVIVNSFEELEPAYVEEYKKARNGKVWCVGPVSLCNKEEKDKVERGNKASIDGSECLKWLDSWEPSSVIYVCLGSLCNYSAAQLIELGLGLEASKKPFIWVIWSGNKSDKGIEEWLLEENFEERIEGRGLLIRGWAPQVLILSHPAIGGFLTHCGWNSMLEAISYGVPVVTWPFFAEQFFNEKLFVQGFEDWCEDCGRTSGKIGR
ncbi:Glycosyltransferase [Melia azedarach]|uniref:Glycosyltransferase n=1 Tax=Melia azedarach TaxID=155640 RepID=A0ACC1Y3S0_MELAZ|nr:Glycosyltransferase [Melia azedarach]